MTSRRGKWPIFLQEGGPILAAPAFTLPEFTWAAQLELVLPLALTLLLF
ncbi:MULTISPECIES: hypothetical protein [unclassified Arthrobacter]